MSSGCDGSRPDKYSSLTRRILSTSCGYAQFSLNLYDVGESRQEVPMLFPGEKAVDIVFSSGSSEVVYVVLQDTGLIRSYDGGVVWEKVQVRFVPVVEGIRLDKLAVTADE